MIKGRCHFIVNDQVIISRGDSLYFVDQDTMKIAGGKNIPSGLSGLGFGFILLNRLLRKGIHHVIRLNERVIIVVCGRLILRYENDHTSKIIHKIEYGSRPLFLCLTDNEMIYWGDYFRNNTRQAVHIYCSRDSNKNDQIVYTFAPGTVRHIHGVFCDPYTGALWVTTGDFADENGMWVSEDRFNTLIKMIGGCQQMRAVQLLFSHSHVYFGSDTALEENYIYRFDKKSNLIEKLQRVDSSVCWGCKVGNNLFFSTVVEPSSVNKTKYACIWGSQDGEKWKCIKKVKKDIWPMKLFQYGQIFFPDGENNTDYLWFTPFATEQHNTVQRLKVSELF